MSLKARFLLQTIALSILGTAAPGQHAGVPIVQGHYLLGGTRGGKWFSAEQTGMGLGQTISLKQIAVDSAVKNVIGRKGEEWDACPGQAIVKIDGNDENDEMPGLFVGSGADWNLVPRKPVQIRADSVAYIQVARAFLRRQGITRSPVKLSQIIEIDLDGDGTREALISGTYYRKAMELSAGDYSFTIIRYGKGKLAKNLLIDGQFLSSSLEYDLAQHQVSGVADVNGDGRIEIALSVTYSESDAQMLFEYKAGKIEKRFEATCGA